jgi:hypothetical protein
MLGKGLLAFSSRIRLSASTEVSREEWPSVGIARYPQRRKTRWRTQGDAVNIYPSYKKPFDLIFARAKNEEWRARRDSNSRPSASKADALSS